MPQRDLYISDLHLNPDEPGVVELFARFMAREVPGARRLIINGDFFNVYYGYAQLRESFEGEIARLLREASESGTEIWFVPGNRDFLFAKDAWRAGAMCTGDELALDDASVLLTHGDTLCLDDRSYLRFRKLMRLLPLRTVHWLIPASSSRWVARKLRESSQRRRREGPPRPMSYFDIKDEAVIPLLERSGASTLICGHIHQPQERIYRLRNGSDARLLVLGDWRPDGAVIGVGESGGGVHLAKVTLDGMQAWPHEPRVVGSVIPAGVSAHG